MDIIITLSKDLWIKIVSGEKGFEMRKWNLPTHFNPQRDHICVVLKGTRRLVGYFDVVKVESRVIKDGAWNDFGKDLGVSYDWFSKYWGEDNYRVMYFFEIGNCHDFSAHFEVEVPCAPQKYVNLTDPMKYFIQNNFFNHLNS